MVAELTQVLSATLSVKIIGGAIVLGRNICTFTYPVQRTSTFASNIKSHKSGQIHKIRTNQIKPHGLHQIGRTPSHQSVRSANGVVI
jgi:hypothetical protein